MQRAHYVGTIAAALEHDGLAMPADVGEQFGATAVVDKRARVVHPAEDMIVAGIRHHEFMADIAGPVCEKAAHFGRKDAFVMIGVHRQLGDGPLKAGQGRDIRHGEYPCWCRQK